MQCHYLKMKSLRSCKSAGNSSRDLKETAKSEHKFDLKFTFVTIDIFDGVFLCNQSVESWYKFVDILFTVY